VRLHKFGLVKTLRIGIWVTLVLLLVLSFYKFYSVYREPSVVEKEIPVYNYNQQGEMNYQVQILPNSIFDETTVGPGQTYFAKLVKSIDVVCLYRYTANTPAQLKAVYSIVAAMDAPKMWHKEFVLVPPTVVQGEGKSISFERAFTINLETYNEFLKSANEQIGVSAREPKLVIRADISLDADGAAGEVREKLVPNMVIPLTSGEFQIDGTLSPQKSGALTKIVPVPVPDAAVKKVKAAVPPVLLVLLLIIFPLITVNQEPAKLSAAEKIWKEHCGRMVRVGDDFMLSDDLIVVNLSSLDDLLKAADEAGKPVILQEVEQPDAAVCFVLDGIAVYRWQIEDQCAAVDSCSGRFAGKQHEHSLSDS